MRHRLTLKKDCESESMEGGMYDTGGETYLVILVEGSGLSRKMKGGRKNESCSF